MAHEELIFRHLLSGPHVSGEDIARNLCVTRATVHKEIMRMRSLGLGVDARPRLGYSLVSPPEAPLPWAVRGYWPEGRDWPVEYIPEVVSTMEIAHDLGRRGAPEGAVVVTDHQSGGRGRRGRTWETPPGEALLASILLRPDMPPADAGMLPLAVAVGAARAVLRVTGGEVEIKWPNDLLIGGDKLAGVLVELTLTEQEIRHAVAGIGLNVRQERFAPGLRTRAVSLRQATGWEGSRAQLLAAIVERVVEAVRTLAHDPERLRADWLKLNCTIGRRVSVQTANGEMEGIAEGIDSYGRLVLRTSDGAQVTLAAGDVSLTSAV